TAHAWQRLEFRRPLLGNLGEGLERLRRLVERIPIEGLTFLFLCITIVDVHALWAAPLNGDRVPVEAVDFIVQEKLPRPILNAFTEGGYLMYRLSNSSGDLADPVSL